MGSYDTYYVDAKTEIFSINNYGSRMLIVPPIRRVLGKFINKKFQVSSTPPTSWNDKWMEAASINWSSPDIVESELLEAMAWFSELLECSLDEAM